MHVEFIESDDPANTRGVIAEAEVHFDDDLPAPFKGKKLIGFTLRMGRSGKPYVNLPGRAFSVGISRYYVNFIQDGNSDDTLFITERSNDELDDVKQFILKEWDARGDS